MEPCQICSFVNFLGFSMCMIVSSLNKVYFFLFKSVELLFLFLPYCID